MRKDSLWHSLTLRLTTGLLLGLLLSPPWVARAQWTVFDPTNYGAKIEEMARDVARWEKTIDHYNKMFDKTVQQVTSLGGILKTVDEQLARNKQLVASIANIGKAVRDVYQLKRQIEAMVQTRIRAVRSLHTRLSAGIFNPQQDLRDLEDYLQNSIGRSSQDTVANVERLANMDNEFERMRYDLQMAWGRLAEAQSVLKQYEAMLAAEMAKPEHERYSLQFIQSQITATKAVIEQINAQINDLTEKLAAKAKTFGLTLQMRADYGEQVENTTKAWEATVPARQEILDTIDREFAQDPGVDDDPADGLTLYF